MKKVIMLVDDEKDIRDVVGDALKKNGYSVLLANNGDDCLKKIKKKRVDIVLLDVMMPGTPAGVVAEKIAPAKVAYFTVAKMEDSERQELLKLENVVGYIQKPFELNEFLSKVKVLLG